MFLILGLEGRVVPYYTCAWYDGALGNKEDIYLVSPERIKNSEALVGLN